MSTTSSIPAKRACVSGCETTTSKLSQQNYSRTGASTSFSTAVSKAQEKETTALLREHDEGYEETISAALEHKYIHNITWHRLQEKYRGKNRHKGHEIQAHLNDEQEETLIEYCKYQGLLAQPLSSLTLRQHVYHLSGKQPSEEWVATLENGWTDDKICVQWFREVFVLWAKRERDPTFPIIFVLDGHGSHKTSSMHAVAVENDIMLISLLPHTTHRLQPLNVGVFAPLQHEWGKCCNALAITGNEVSRDTVIEEYMPIRHAHMKQSLIISAWQHSGLHPYNPDIFTDADFAPAVFFSVKPMTPKGYPSYVPSSSEEAEATGPNGETSDESYCPSASPDTTDPTMADHNQQVEHTSSIELPNMLKGNTLINVELASPCPAPSQSSLPCPPPLVVSNISSMISLSSIQIRSAHAKCLEEIQHLKSLSSSSSFYHCSLASISSLPSGVKDTTEYDQRKTLQEMQQKIDTVAERVQQAEQQLAQALHENQELKAQMVLQQQETLFYQSNHWAASSHATLKSFKNMQLHEEMNSKKQKKCKVVNSLGRLITSHELGLVILEQIAQDEACEQEEIAAKKAKEVAAQHALEDLILNKATCKFDGAVKSMKKPALQALAYALNLPRDGNREVLTMSILQWCQGMPPDFRPEPFRPELSLASSPLWKQFRAGFTLNTFVDSCGRRVGGL
ncbi:hypothetical protein M422DRAFT_240032, partial [Sphaerobolus stellatus SS14]